MNKIFFLLGFMVVALIIVSVAIGMHIGPIVKMGIEEGGLMATQVAVKVD